MARATIALGAACEYHDLEAYEEAIREAAFAELDLASYKEIRNQPETSEAEKELQECTESLGKANFAYLSSRYPGARKALAQASIHLDKFLASLGPFFTDLREDLLPLITPTGSDEPKH